MKVQKIQVGEGDGEPVLVRIFPKATEKGAVKKREQESEMAKKTLKRVAGQGRGQKTKETTVKKESKAEPWDSGIASDAVIAAVKKESKAEPRDRSDRKRKLMAKKSGAKEKKTAEKVERGAKAGRKPRISERNIGKPEEPKKPKRWRVGVIFRWVFGGVCLAMLVFAGWKIYEWHIDNLEAEELQAETTEVAEVHEVESEGELVNPPSEEDTEKQSDYWYFVGLPFYEVNFDELKARNPDTVAFIHMNNNNVNYPVVQSSDNDYYLHHAFDGSYNDSGWVFMDYRSGLNPPSQNLVIYGHGRYNGTVFGSLQSALTAEWQSNRDNYVIWLSTPTENLVYQIFSIYAIDAESYYIRQNFTAAEWQTWIETMASRNTAPLASTVSAADQVLTLSTCKDDFGHRIVVQARLIKRQAR